MNRNAYRTVFNEASGTMVAVPEMAASIGKANTVGAGDSVVRFVDTTSHSLRVFCLTLAAALLGAAYNPISMADTLPNKGQVVAGSGRATIETGGSTMTITQATQKVVINWDSFNIGAGSAVNFVQPSTSSVALNRVVGGNPTEIAGSMTANGQVFLINPMGITFAKGATVDVGGMVASTLGMTDANFMAGRYQFDSTDNGGKAGDVVNSATLRTNLKKGESAGGSIVLIGRKVINDSDGSIITERGSTVLAAGDTVSLALDGRGLLQAEVTLGHDDAYAANRGLLEANAGTVLMTAKFLTPDSGNKLVNNESGIIRANAIDTTNGVIRLVGGMNSGVVLAANDPGRAYIEAKGAAKNTAGGFVEIKGQSVHVRDAVINVEGDAPGTISLHAGKGISIDNVGSTGITPSDIQRFLGVGHLKVRAGTGDAGSQESLTITNGFKWSSANSLSLVADNHIIVGDQNINADGGGTITLRAGVVDNKGIVETSTNRPINSAGGIVNIYSNAPGGDFNSPRDFANDGSIGGSPSQVNNYMLINNKADLQTLSNNGGSKISFNGKKFALNNDIDGGGDTLKAIQNFHDAVLDGYDGYSAAGSRKTISNFTFEKGDGAGTGLLNELHKSTIVRNLNLKNITINGGDTVGGLAGSVAGQSRVENVSISASNIRGETNVGGLVGILYDGTLTRIASDATVSGNTQVGGVAGWVKGGKGLISQSYFGRNGVVTVGKEMGGGIAGLLSEGTISESYNEGLIQGREGGDTTKGLAAARLGGIAGHSEGGTISYAYNQGHIDGAELNGGIAGSQSSGSRITQVYNSGYVRPEGGSGAIVSNQNAGNVEVALFNRLTTGSVEAGGGTEIVTVKTDETNGKTYAGSGLDLGDGRAFRIIEGVSQPYFAWRYPNAPVVVSGQVVLKDQPKEQQLTQLQVQSGDMNTGGNLGITRTQADGSFYFTMDSTADAGSTNGRGGAGAMSGKDSNAALTVRLQNDKDTKALVGVTASMGTNLANEAHTGQTDGTTTRAHYTGMNVYQDTLTLSGGNNISFANVLAAMPQASKSTSDAPFAITSDDKALRNNLVLDAGQNFRTEIGGNHLADGDVNVQEGSFLHYGTAHLQNDGTTLWQTGKGGGIFLGASQDKIESEKNGGSAREGTGGVFGNGNNLSLQTSGSVSQQQMDAGIQNVNTLTLSSGAGISLLSEAAKGAPNAGNAFTNLQITDGSGSQIDVRNTTNTVITGIAAGSSVVNLSNENAGTTTTQTGGIQAASLSINGGGDVVLRDGAAATGVGGGAGTLGNAVSSLAVNGASGAVIYQQQAGFGAQVRTSGSLINLQSRAGALSLGDLGASGTNGVIQAYGQSSLIINSGSHITAAGAGNGDVLLATQGVFTNNQKHTAADKTITVSGSGSYHVYADNVATSTANGLIENRGTTTKPRFYGEAVFNPDAVTTQSATDKNSFHFVKKPTLNITAANSAKTYNGQNGVDPAAALNTTATWVTSDNVTDKASDFNFSGGAASRIAGNNAGTYAVSVANFTVDSYAVGAKTGATFTINKANLALAAVTDTRVYNGATNSTQNVAVTGLQAGDSFIGNQSYASKNVMGAGNSTLQVTNGYSITNGLGNYNITTTTANGTITAAALTLTAGTQTKTYDGTTASNGTVTNSGMFGSDNVTGATQAYASKNVLGAGNSTLAVTGYTVNDGNGGKNYVVTTATAVGTITAAPVITAPVATAQTVAVPVVSNDPAAMAVLVSAQQTGAGEAAGGQTVSSRSTGTTGNFATHLDPKLETQGGGVSIQLEVAQLCYERIADNGEIVAACQ